MSHATSRTERMDMDEDDSDSEDMGERNVEDECKRSKNKY